MSVCEMTAMPFGGKIKEYQSKERMDLMKKIALCMCVIAVMLAAGCQAKSKAPVLEPNALLSSEKASAITGFAVALDKGSLYRNTESGIISERYVYDINKSTIHALVQIEQNGLKTDAAINAGNTALKSFTTESEFSKKNITSVDLGDKAFSVNGTGQLHMVYQDYYIIVAFDAHEYETTGNAALNILLGKEILANLKQKLK